MYRDCLNGQAGFDNSITLFIYRSTNGSLYTTRNITAPFTTPEIIPAHWDACTGQPYNLCVEFGRYTADITLPPIAGGYDIAWARCCRNNTVTNIAQQQGITVLAHVPGTEVPGCNSMPQFKDLPPLFLCVGQPAFLDQSAIDPDGDSLVYVISNPYDGVNQFGAGATFNNPTVNGGNPMGPPPYDNVNYLGGYSWTDPFGSGSYGIDAQSGLLTLTPTQLGLSVFAISVLEYRNGVLLSENKRDFQINVIQCAPQGQPPLISSTTPPVPTSGDTLFIETNQNLCYNLGAQDPVTGDTVILFEVSAIFGIGGTLPTPYADLSYTGINPVSGQVCWQPSCDYAGDTISFIVGARDTSDCPGYNLAFDTTYVVVESLEDPIVDHTLSGNFSGDTLFVDPGEIFCYTFDASDDNNNDLVTISPVQGPFSGTNAANIVAIGNNPVTGNVCWQVPCDSAGQTIPFIIAASDNGLCPTETAYDTVIISVNPLPPTSAGPDTSVCAGEPVQLNATGGTTYAWTPVTDLNNPAIQNPIATPQTTTNYTASIFTAQGCVQTETVQIVAIPSPVADAGPDLVKCPGTPLQLSATGGNSFSWASAPGLSATNIANPTTSQDATTSYFVTVTSGNGCTDTDTVDVLLMEADAGPDLDLCEGDSVTLQASVNTGPATYSWNNPTTLSNPNIANPNAGPIVSIDYIVTVTDTNTCVDMDTARVTIRPLPTANAGNDTSVCRGQFAFLSGSGGLVYSWDPNIALSNPNISNPTASPTSTTEYELTVTDGFGCQDKDSVIVNIIPLPIVSAGNDTAKCGDIGVEIQATGGVSYVWAPNFGLSNPNIANPIANPNASITYTVTATDINGCSNTDDIFVRVMRADAGPDQVICIGDTTPLNATGGIAYDWDNGGFLSATNVFNPDAFPSTTTDFIVVATDITGCTDTDTMTITVNPLPIADAGLDQNICIGSNTTLTATGGISYVWTPGGSLSNPNISNPVASPASTTTYHVTVTDINTCVNTDSVTIQVLQLPSVDAGDNVVKCPDSTVTLQATGGVQFQWNPAATLSDNSISNPIADPPSTTTYYVLVTDIAGCQNTDSVIVWVMEADAGPDVAICIGDSIQLGASGGVGFSWTPSNTLSNANVFDPHAFPSTTTQYTVVVTDTVGCTDIDDLIVTVNPLPNANAGSDAEICIGEETQLTATGGISYSWTPTISLSDPNLANPMARPTTTTEYEVTVTDANTCVNTDQVEVIVHPLPLVNAGNDTTICRNEAAILTGIGAIDYTWSPPADLTSPNASTTLASPPFTTNYTLTGVDQNGCVNTDEMALTVIQLPIAESIPEHTICIGDSITLSVTGGIDYTWNTGQTGSPITVKPDNTIIYQVTPYDQGCAGDPLPIRVNVIPNLPEAAFSVSPIDGYFPLDVTFTNESQYASRFYWNFGDGNTSTETNPVHTYTDDGEFIIRLIADNRAGCPDTAWFEAVTVLDFTFFVPNAFTPNNDGFNDEFFIVPKGIESMRFAVFNRWGKVIYEANTLDFRWDGKDQEGNAVPEGVYIYRVWVEARGRKAERTGSITIIR